MLAFRAAGFMATRTLGESPGVRMSWSEMWTWKAETPFSVPAGARISAGKSGNVDMSLPERALDVVKRSPVSCMPSPESPANRTMTWSSWAVSAAFPMPRAASSRSSRPLYGTRDHSVGPSCTPAFQGRISIRPYVSFGHSAYPPGADAPGQGHRNGSLSAGSRQGGDGAATSMSPAPGPPPGARWGVRRW
jgi:hypothetical protein